MSTVTAARALGRAPLSDTETADPVRVRPLQPGDAAAVRAVFAGLGARSRQLRFLTHKPRLTEGEVRALTAVDGHDHEALLASAADGAPVGIARFVRSAEDAATAEVAVAVVDAWHGRGVGTTLLGALTRRAVELGVRRFRADVATDNAIVLHVLRRSGVAWSWLSVGHGVGQVQVQLAGPPSRGPKSLEELVGSGTHRNWWPTESFVTVP